MEKDENIKEGSMLPENELIRRHGRIDLDISRNI